MTDRNLKQFVLKLHDTIKALGLRNVAIMNLTTFAALDRDDYVYLRIRNLTATRNVTAEVDSYMLVTRR